MRLSLALSILHRPLAAHFSAARRHSLSRAVHSAKAELTTLDSKGAPTTKHIGIFIGDPGESYIIFGKDVGAAMAAGVGQQQAGSDPERVPLTFFHESRCFANNATAYPQITIEQDLPRQNDGNQSPATLWLWGASHSITLDGTADHGFEVSERESHHRLKGVTELLKDIPAQSRSRVRRTQAKNPCLPQVSELSPSHPTNIIPCTTNAAISAQTRAMPAATYRFLTAAQVQRLHARHIARAAPTQPAMLESAVHSPVSQHRYGQAADVFTLAGVVAEKIILNHPFQDGNKRTALFAADMFLGLNGYRLRIPPADTAGRGAGRGARGCGDETVDVGGSGEMSCWHGETGTVGILNVVADTLL